MAINSIYNILCAIIFSITLVNTYTTTAGYATDKLLFVFGDSLFDPGNNGYLPPNLTNIASYHYPYGISLNISTGRFSDGLVLPDFIAKLANLPIIPPFLNPNATFEYGVSFASAGSGALNIHPNVMNLNMQLKNFKRVVKEMNQIIGYEEATRRLKGSVYLFSMGGNDYFDFAGNYPNATFKEMTEYVNIVIGNLINTLKDIYAAGGRKVAFQNVAPLGCLPMIKDIGNLKPDECSQPHQKLAILHNHYLSLALKKLETNLTDFKYSIFKYFNQIQTMITNPSLYGFKVGKIACCGAGAYRGKDCGSTENTYTLCKNRTEYLFFDGGHTTQQTNIKLSQLFWNGTTDVVGPYNLKQLFQLP